PAAPTVTETDIQKSVGTKGQHAAVVIRKRLRDGEEYAVECRRGGIGIDGIRKESRDHSVSIGVRVVHIKPAVRGIVGIKRHAEEALFTTCRNLAHEVHKLAGEQRPVSDDSNRAALLDDEQPSSVSRRTRQED